MILERVRKTIKRYSLVGKGDKVLIGVSGGPDSVALLYLLNSLKRELKITLHIAHLDHMLRRDSSKDSKFVKQIADRLKVPITSGQINVKGIAKKGSLEEIARNARLGFLFKVARDIKADEIALGHNRDDQAETVLMRILRGTGLHGLSGILPKRNIAGYEVIRPLIEVGRKEIEAFLKKKTLKARTDTSNLKDIYFRNRIRNKLLPLLEKEYNKNIKEVLSNMAESVSYDYSCLYKIADSAMRRFGPRLNLKRFLKLPKAIQRIVLRLSIAKLKGDTRRISFRHIGEIEDLIFNRPTNSIVDLPKAVSVIKKKNNLCFFKRQK